ncbi:MAG: hypothetical protein AB4038_04570, partial [Prochloraceae cyanobacterium]
MFKNLAGVITYLKSRLSAANRFILIALLTCTLTLTSMPATVGQIPFLPTSSNQTTTETPGWDLNKAERCVKYWCSDVYFYQFSTTTPLSADLTLASLRQENQSEVEVAQALEERARLVQGIVRDIFTKIISWKTIPEVDFVEDWKFWLPTKIKFWLPTQVQSWLPTRVQSPHPWTPRIEVGIEQGQTVLYAPAQPELGLAPQTIVTVTGIDAKANGTTKEKLAESWQTNLRLSLSSALWGHELNVQHPWLRQKLAVAIAAVALVLISIINGILWLLARWRKYLKGQIENLTDSLTIDPEAVSLDKDPEAISEEKIDAIVAPDGATPTESDTSSPSEAMASEPDDSTSMPVEPKSDVHPQVNPPTKKSLFDRIGPISRP